MTNTGILPKIEQQHISSAHLTIHTLFEQRVATDPDRRAIVFRDQALTYRELNEKANQLARALRQTGVTRDTIVGLKVKRSPEMIIGLLAILKAGGAYLPIDPEYPAARIEHMLSHSGTSVLLTQQTSPQQPHLPQVGATLLDLFDEQLYLGDATNLPPVNAPEDAAYVIFTSGSTGTPKGIVIEHKSVLNLFEGLTQQIDFSAGKSILALTTISFDIFVVETLLPLVKGMTIVIADEQAQIDVELLRDLIVRSKVDLLQLTPSRLRLLIGEGEGLPCLKNVREILVGGEAFPDYLLARLSACDCTVYNGYGPTETTVYSLIKRLHHGEKVTIGRPIANTRVYIVNEKDELQPVGAEGELLIGGAGLARGYLHAAQLTAQKFIDAPFLPGERVYRTGDLARWTADGEVDFLGRIDRQIKLRGYRIELGEIESLLLDHRQISTAVVEVRTGPDQQQYLCAYVVARKGHVLEAAALRAYLSERLPVHMVPSFFVPLDAIPLTPNGKIDYRSLPEPNLAPAVDHVPPRDKQEERIAEMWADLLGVQKEAIGIDQSFFIMGGHSLTAALFLARLHKEVHVKIPMGRFFENATIRGIAAFIKVAHPSSPASIEPAPLKEGYPLSSEQKRVFVLYCMAPESTAYNIPEMYRVEGTLDLARLEETFRRLVERHESFRTSFELRDGEPIQKIHPSVSFAIETWETSEDSAREQLARFVRPFDLSQAPLLRVAVVKTGSQRSFLMIDMHHVIADGFSRDVLLKDFVRLYMGESLPPLRIQYKDYLEWQQKNRASERFQQQKAYWLNMFEGNIPLLNLPTDYPRPKVRRLEGSKVHFDLDRDIMLALKTLAHEEHASLFMVLFAAVSTFLAKLSGQADITIGTPSAGRDHMDLEPLVGMFVNTLALRTHPDDEKPFRAFVREIREIILGALENQNYQFDELVDEICPIRTPNRNPLFDVMFVLQDTETQPFQIPGVCLQPHPYENATSKVDLTVHMRETEDRLACHLEYDTQLFKQATIELMRDRFLVMLGHVLSDPACRIGDLDCKTEAEKALSRFENVEFEFF